MVWLGSTMLGLVWAILIAWGGVWLILIKFKLLSQVSGSHDCAVSSSLEMLERIPGSKSGWLQIPSSSPYG